MFENDSPDRVAIEEGIVVGMGGGRELRADVYLPQAGTSNGAGVLAIHGGGWRTGDRTWARYCLPLSRVGYTCIACEYRLTPGAKWPAQLDDVRTALDWMRAQAGELAIDKDRIAVQGNSAGSHIGLMLAAQAPGIAACAVNYAPTDLSFRVDAARLTELQERTIAQLLPRVDADALADASPITHVSPSFPPTMLIHGSADKIVSVGNSLRMYEALNTAGAKAELHIFEGQPHAFDRAPALRRQCASLMELFFRRHVLEGIRGRKLEARSII